jgi:hypothetical protein
VNWKGYGRKQTWSDLRQYVGGTGETGQMLVSFITMVTVSYLKWLDTRFSPLRHRLNPIVTFVVSAIG